MAKHFLTLLSSWWSSLSPSHHFETLRKTISLYMENSLCCVFAVFFSASWWCWEYVRGAGLASLWSYATPPTPLPLWAQRSVVSQWTGDKLLPLHTGPSCHFRVILFGEGSENCHLGMNGELASFLQDTPTNHKQGQKKHFAHYGTISQ